MNPENNENRAIDQMRRKIAEDEQKIKCLRRDHIFLTDLLGKRIRSKSKYSSLRGIIDDYAEDNDVDETIFSNADHVE